MSQLDDFLAWERSKIGTPYRNAPGRCDPNSPFHDCSGYVSAALVVAKARPVGFCTDTEGFIAELHANPACIAPLSEVRVTPGMVAIRPDHNSVIPGVGHIVTSIGIVNGTARTYEAASTAQGVIVGYFDSHRGLAIGGRLPGLQGYGAVAGQGIGQGVSVGWKQAFHPKSTKAHPMYWECDDAGHVYSYNVPYYGGQGATMKDGVPVAHGTPGGTVVALNGACTSFIATPSGNGYSMTTAVGSIYAFGDAGRSGDPFGNPST